LQSFLPKNLILGIPFGNARLEFSKGVKGLTPWFSMACNPVRDLLPRFQDTSFVKVRGEGFFTGNSTYEPGTMLRNLKDFVCHVWLGWFNLFGSHP